MSPRMDREVSAQVEEFGTIPVSAGIRSTQTKRPIIVPDLVLKEYGDPFVSFDGEANCAWLFGKVNYRRGDEILGVWEGSFE